MPRTKKSATVYELAKRGAELRLQEVLQEARLLIDLFPHLRDAFDRDELPLKFIIANDSDRTSRKAGRRRRMSGEARQAASDRMKKYWAARRKG